MGDPKPMKKKELRRTVALQETQIEELKEDLESTKGHLDDARGAAGILEMKLGIPPAYKAATQKRLDMIEEGKARIAELAGQVDDLKSEIHHREDAAWTIGEMNAAAAKIETLTADNGRITESLCKKIAELQTANRRIVEQDRRVEGLLKRLFRAEKQIDEIVSIIGIDQ